VKTGCQKCTIEAQFDISRYNLNAWFDENELDVEEGECIIRRELTATGKSRGFINDTPVTVQQMKELGDMLVDIHSQHQNLLLQKTDFQLSILDIIADNEPLRVDYQKTYAEYKKNIRELEELKQSLADSRDKEDLMRFQLEELSSANLTDGEQEELEQEQEVATHYCKDVYNHQDEGEGGGWHHLE
jgi:DNA repair protein RecN (Recombination protein N)